MGVSVKGPDPDTNLNFRLEDHAPIISIKFSPDRHILAVQRSQTSVEFANYNGDGSLSAEYSQSCRKGSKMLGFIWTGPSYVAFITDNGVEPFQVLHERRSVKALKAITATADWFKWNADCNLAILSSGQGTQLQPISFKSGTATKLAKIERRYINIFGKGKMRMFYDQFWLKTKSIVELTALSGAMLLINELKLTLCTLSYKNFSIKTLFVFEL